MQGRKFLPLYISHDQIYRLDQGNNNGPDNDRDRQLNGGQDFNKTHKEKYKISNCIELRSELADGTPLSCHGTVDHIRDTGSDIEDVERR